MPFPASAKLSRAVDNEKKSEPQVTITPPLTFKTKNVLLFPLRLPAYVIRAGLWPLGEGLSYLDRKRVVSRALDLLSNKDQTLWVYPIVEGGAGSGFGGGLGVSDSDLFHTGYAIGATYRVHVNLDQHATFSFGKVNALSIGRAKFSFMFASDWQDITSNDFYGIGNSTPRSAKARYGSDITSIGVMTPFSLFDIFNVSPHIGVRLDQTHAADKAPQVRTSFPAWEIPGYGKWIHYLDAGIELMNDTTERTDDPNTGGRRRLSFRTFQSLNVSKFSYNEYKIDVRQYIGLTIPDHVLMLRGAFTAQHAIGDGKIPFWELATLDYTTPVRGFSRGRFRDRDLLVANAEYRFPLWDMLRGVIFFDTGRVYDSMGSLTLSDLKYSVGGGAHIKIKDLGRFRFEAAYGGEGAVIMFGTSKPL